MSLFTERTQLDQDLAFKDSLILRSLDAATHLVGTLRECYDLFYALPADRLAAVLNHDLAATGAMFDGNTGLGAAANTSLDLASYGAVRAPVTLPPHVTFNGTEFIVAP